MWTEEAAQAWPDGAGGEGAQGTSGVVAAIGAGEGSVGYADASQVGELGAAQIKVGERVRRAQPGGGGEGRRGVGARRRAAASTTSSFKLDRDTTEAGVYPIALVSYHIVCLQYDDQAKADLVKAFMAYVGSAEGQAAAAEAAGSAPMSAELMEQVPAVRRADLAPGDRPESTIPPARGTVGALRAPPSRRARVRSPERSTPWRR